MEFNLRIMRIYARMLPALLLCFLSFSNVRAQYDIEVLIPDFAGDTLLFGHYLNESIILKDTFFLDSGGSDKISGEESLPPGMYTLYFPNRTRFDLLIDKDQVFSLRTDTLDLLKQTEFKGTEDNEIFYHYLAFLEEQRNRMNNIRQRISNPVNVSDSLQATKEMAVINETVKTYIDRVINENEPSFVSTFLRSMKEVEVPDPPRDEAGNIIDSTFQMRYYKAHYFDNFNISDVRLLRTPMYENKLMNYLDRWVYPVPDSLYKEVDWLVSKSRSDTLLFKYMLTTLLNYYAKSKYVGMDAVYAYIADKYYIQEATWSSPDFIQKLRERVEKITPLVIGKEAPDAQLVIVSDDHFLLAAEDTAVKRNPYVGDFFNLHDVEADFIILYFWEADCGHCRTNIPKLHELYLEKLKELGVKVVAVNMLGGVEGKVKWIDFVNEHALYDWINAWNPYDFAYREAYDLSSSNLMYLLDKNKKIIAKRINAEQAEKIIEAKMNDVD